MNSDSATVTTVISTELTMNNPTGARLKSAK